MPIQFQLSGSSLEELQERVRSEYGPTARIVGAERVTVGGLAGFFAKQHIEVTIELPELPRTDEARPIDSGTAVAGHQLLNKRGIAALLAAAEEQETEYHRSPRPDVSTQSPEFAHLLDELSAVVGLAGVRPVPEVLRSPGDLVVVAGLGSDPLKVARSMAAANRVLSVHASGNLNARGIPYIKSREEALSARASGVTFDKAVLLAYSLMGDVDRVSADLRMFAADQLWLAVDASRKVEDTTTWVEQLTGHPIDALAVIGTAYTSSPETVNSLGYPIGWLEDGKASSSALPTPGNWQR